MAEQIFGVTTFSANADTALHLVSFDSSSPAAAPIIGELDAFAQGYYIRAIDFRPATGELYAIGHTSGNTGKLFKVNTSNASVTGIGPGFPHAYDPFNRSTGRMSMDFDPVTDTIRLITGNRENMRIDPDTGMLLATDAGTAFVSGDVNAGIVSETGDLAYSGSVAGATSTTCYSYDFTTNYLATIGDLNGSPLGASTGALHSIASTGLTAVDAGVGFDISGVTGTAFLSLNQTGTANSADEFYTINLATGATTLLGTSNRNLLDIAVAPVPEPTSMLVIVANVAGVFVRRSRR